MPYDRAAIVAIAIKQIVEDLPEPGETWLRVEQYLRDDFAAHEQEIASDREIPDA